MIYPWQTRAWETVQRAINANHLHHALLLSGEEGCGNSVFARSLAQSLLCLSPADDGSACGQCRSCQVFAARAHPDFMPVALQEDKQSILIEQIRELNYFLGLSRSYSPRRVAVIAPAERMNVNAANSLLKSLEEPAPDTHILLLTGHPAALLPTIRSRCQEIRLPVPSHNAAAEWLRGQELRHSPENLLEASGGRPLTALELDATETLAERQQWLKHLLQLAQGQGNIAEISSHWEKHDRVRLLNWQLSWLISIVKGNITQAPAALPAEVESLRGLITQKKAFKIHERLIELKKFSTHPLNARSYIESMLVLWSL